jgi:hypothetical protein
VGYLSDIRIWDVERTASEIAENYSAPLNGDENGLLGYWPLESDYDDKTANARNGNLIIYEKGMYFDKKTYTSENIPIYNNIKSQLPKPILDGNPEWITMYDKAWQLAFSHIKKPASGSPLVSNFYDEAFDGSIYQWDMIFMTMFGKYAHHIFPGIQSLDNFYCRQNPSGSISRVINEATGADAFADGSSNQINPPLFSWAEVENFKVTGDKSRFALILPALEKYFEYVEKDRSGANRPHKLYWSNGQSSGMDNTPRDTGRPNGHYASDHQGWVDMSSQMVIQCNNIATICEELGDTEKAELYRAKVSEIAGNINKWMWDETSGLFYDVDIQGAKTNWKTAACFWPMLAEITSSEQVSAMTTNLKDPATFWRDMPFPTLAASHTEYRSNGGYWLGAVWAPTNYAIIKGLEKNGENAFAKEASEKYLHGLSEVFKQTGTLWENYAADKIDGKFKQGVNDNFSNPSDCRKDFVGWTGLGPIALLIENVLGFRLDGVNRIITYDLRRTDRHGIENLHIADITTSIVCEERTDNESAILTVTSDQPYTLKILFNGKEFSQDIQVGTHEITLTSTAIHETLPSAAAVRVLDNPVSNTLGLEFSSSKSGDAQLYLFDTTGRKIMNRLERIPAGQSQKQIQVENLRKGVYFLLVVTENDRMKQKILKI